MNVILPLELAEALGVEDAEPRGIGVRVSLADIRELATDADEQTQMVVLKYLLETVGLSEEDILSG